MNQICNQRRGANAIDIFAEALSFQQDWQLVVDR